jgi:hypothetical protein
MNKSVGGERVCIFGFGMGLGFLILLVRFTGYYSHIFLCFSFTEFSSGFCFLMAFLLWGGREHLVVAILISLRGTVP